MCESFEVATCDSSTIVLKDKTASDRLGSCNERKSDWFSVPSPFDERKIQFSTQGYPG